MSSFKTYAMMIPRQAYVRNLCLTNLTSEHFKWTFQIWIEDKYQILIVPYLGIIGNVLYTEVDDQAYEGTS